MWFKKSNQREHLKMRTDILELRKSDVEIIEDYLKIKEKMEYLNGRMRGHTEQIVKMFKEINEKLEKLEKQIGMKTETNRKEIT